MINMLHDYYFEYNDIVELNNTRLP